MDEAKKDKHEPELSEVLEEVEESKVLPEATEQEKLEEKLGYTNDRLLRLAAEFDNYKKISARERIQSIKFANEGLILNLLPIMDNLEQAVKAGKSADQDLLVGVKMVLKQMVDALAKSGVEFFSAEGQAFDPNRHEAVCEQEVSGVDAGTVVEEYQKGCLYNGRLLRAARVAVAKKSSN